VTDVDLAGIETRLEEQWQSLKALVDSLSAEELQEPGVVEGWSVKDLLGHMAFWANKAAGDLALARNGRADEIEVPFIPNAEGSGGENVTDDWNAREAAARKGKSLEDVRQEWEDSFHAAQSALTATPPEVLDREVQGWSMLVRFREDTYNHYKEHAEQIREWQRNLETTEA
jgi:uncharacterized protein (TIGR03083 family)